MSVKDRNPKLQSWRAPVKVMEFFTVRLAQLTFHKVTCTNIQSRLHCPSAYAAGTVTASATGVSRAQNPERVAPTFAAHDPTSR